MIDKKLKDLGISLPEPPVPAGSYIPVRVTHNTAFVSGQIPLVNGIVEFKGKVNNENINDAQESAKICAVNILAQLKKEIGSLDRISKIIKISGFVNSAPDFTKHPTVINAASDLIFSIFGDRGRHARIALGVTSLPLNAMTEIDAIVEFS